MGYAEDRERMADYRCRFARYNRVRKAILRRYLRCWHRFEVIGLDNIPPGPALIAVNHSGGLDLDIVALQDCCHPSRTIHPLIVESWHFLNSAWGRWWVGGGIPLWTRGGIRWDYIDPYLVEGGEFFPGLVAIFPEGGSSTFRERRRLLPFFPGVVRIALRYRVPIVPVALAGFARAVPIVYEIERDHGPNDIISPLFAFPFKLKAEFGEPLELSEHYGKELSKDEERSLANEVVRSKVAALLRKHQPVDSD